MEALLPEGSGAGSLPLEASSFSEVVSPEASDLTSNSLKEDSSPSRGQSYTKTPNFASQEIFSCTMRSAMSGPNGSWLSVGRMLYNLLEALHEGLRLPALLHREGPHNNERARCRVPGVAGASEIRLAQGANTRLDIDRQCWGCEACINTTQPWMNNGLRS